MILNDIERCGDCTVCCEVMGFTGKWKPFDRYNEAEEFDIVYDEWSDCNKLCSIGCSIHKSHPRICKEFLCSYITEELPDDHRPNLCGIVAYHNPEHDEVWLISTDKETPPQKQYEDKKQFITDMVEDIFVSMGKRYEVSFITKKGSMRL